MDTSVTSGGLLNTGEVGPSVSISAPKTPASHASTVIDFPGATETSKTAQNVINPNSSTDPTTAVTPAPNKPLQGPDTPAAATFAGIPKVAVKSVQEGTPIAAPSKMTNKSEAEWRANVKYTAVMSQVKDGLPKTMEQAKGVLNHDTAESMLLKMKEPGSTYPHKSGDARSETQHYLKKALDCLNNPGAFATPREAHQAYKHAMRSALESTGYTENPYLPEALILNCLCASEFTQVNIQELTQNFAESKSGVEIHEDGSAMEVFGHNVEGENLESIHKGVGNKESVAQKVKGEVMVLGLDPLMQGNPANVKAKVNVSKNGQEHTVTDVRTPTPTDGKGNVVPEFKAFLRFLGNCDPPQKYTMVNLQNRVSHPLFSLKRTFDCNGEHVRSGNLEALAKDPEFSGTITVVTLDKNSHFFHQSPTKKDLKAAINALPEDKVGQARKQELLKLVNKTKLKGLVEDKKHWNEVAKEICDAARAAGVENQLGKSLIMSKSDFQGEFMRKLMDDNKGFHLPENYKKDQGKQQIADTLQHISDTVFAGVDPLSPQERQDFIEIAYAMLTADFVADSGASYFNQSCKDCIDRGGGANWLMMAMTTLKEVKDHNDKNPGDPMPADLAAKVKALPHKLQEDALWARKRGLIHERLERAEGAINRLVTLAQNEPTKFDQFYKQYAFKKTEFLGMNDKKPEYQENTVPQDQH